MRYYYNDIMEKNFLLFPHLVFYSYTIITIFNGFKYFAILNNIIELLQIYLINIRKFNYLAIRYYNSSL